MPTIKVRAVGTALVTDYDAMERGTKRFIGRRVSKVSPPLCDVCAMSLSEDAPYCPACSTHDAPIFPKHEFALTNEPETVSARHEHVQAVRDGHLVPVDAESAALCGVAAPSAAAPKKAKES
jgi:hypothetical protein